MVDRNIDIMRVSVLLIYEVYEALNKRFDWDATERYIPSSLS